MNENDLGQELADLFGKAAKEFGKELLSNGKVLAEYAAKELRQLAAARGEPGFDKIAQATRDNIVLEASGSAVDQGDKFDERARGIADAVISIGLRLLGA